MDFTHLQRVVVIYAIFTLKRETHLSILGKLTSEPTHLSLTCFQHNKTRSADEKNDYFVAYVCYSFPEYTHSVYYTLPPDGKGHVGSNLCKLTSDRTINCYGNVTYISYDPSNHSATASESMTGSTTFYEKGYEPKANPLSGTWHSNGHPQCSMGSMTINLSHAIGDVRVFYPSSYKADDSGSLGEGIEMYLIQDENTHQIRLVDAISGFREVNALLFHSNNNAIYDFDKIPNSVVKLNSSRSKYDEACDLTKIS